MEVNTTTLKIAACVAGTLFLGYCLYFDKKRRNDPEYKQKIRERRRRNRKIGSTAGSRIPNLSDHEAVQKFFLEEIQNGESKISEGDIDRGTDHLANAVLVCGQPTQLLQVLQQTLPVQVFTCLLQKMRALQENVNRRGDQDSSDLFMAYD